jgi:hypothetical protein
VNYKECRRERDRKRKEKLTERKQSKIDTTRKERGREKNLLKREKLLTSRRFYGSHLAS